MSTILELEYISYRNIESEIPSEIPSENDESLTKILEKIYNKSSFEETTYDSCDYAIQIFTIQKDASSTLFSLYLCTRKISTEGSGESITNIYGDSYLVVPEVKTVSGSKSLKGINAYKIIDKQLETKLLEGSMIGGVNVKAKIQITYKDIALLGFDDDKFVFPDKSCFLEGKHENLYDKFKGGKYIISSTYTGCYQ